MTDTDETSRRHPPQATATEAREATHADRQPNPIFLRDGEDYLGERRKGLGHCNYPMSANDAGAVAKELLRLRELILEYEYRTATAPNDAAGGETGRLVSMEEIYTELVRWDEVREWYMCWVCHCVGRVMGEVNHDENCPLESWKRELLAASPRPEAEDDTDSVEALWEMLGYERVYSELTRNELTAAREALATAFDFRAHLANQHEWSEKTFGPGTRAQGVVDHIRRELLEIEAKPTDLTEWIDVVILSLDGAWRAGYSSDEIVAALVAKQKRNEGRTWPDWRTSDPNKAITHTAEPQPAHGPEARSMSDLEVEDEEWHDIHDQANEDIRDGTLIPPTDNYERRMGEA